MLVNPICSKAVPSKINSVLLAKNKYQSIQLGVCTARTRDE